MSAPGPFEALDAREFVGQWPVGLESREDFIEEYVLRLLREKGNDDW